MKVTSKSVIIFFLAVISVMVFGFSSNHDNAATLLNSIVIALSPFLVDFIFFIKELKYRKKDKLYNVLYCLNLFLIFMLSCFIIIWILKSVDVLILDENTKYFLKLNGDSSNFINKLLKKILNCKIMLRFHCITFILSAILRFFNEKCKPNK